MKGACEAVEKALTSDKDGRCRNRLLSIRRKSCAGPHNILCLHSISVVEQIAFTKGVVVLVAKGAEGVGKLASKSFL